MMFTGVALVAVGMVGKRWSTMKIPTRIALLAALPVIASAHEGHEVPAFLPGLFHPMTGLDHLLAMVTVGLLGARLGGAHRVLMPLTFLVALAMGAMLPHLGALLEPGVAGTVALLGILLAVARPPALPVAVAVVAVAGLFHGAAHAAEAPAMGTGLFAAGMLLGSGLLHGLGLVGGLVAPRFQRPVGGAVAVAGLVLAIIAAGG